MNWSNDRRIRIALVVIIIVLVGFIVTFVTMKVTGTPETRYEWFTKIKPKDVNLTIIDEGKYVGGHEELKTEQEYNGTPTMITIIWDNETWMPPFNVTMSNKYCFEIECNETCFRCEEVKP